MKTFKLAMLIAAGLLAAAAGTATAQQPAGPASHKYGYVNPERVIRESRQSQKMLKDLDDEFKTRSAEISGGPKEDIDRRMTALTEDMNAKRNEVHRRFVESANVVIRRIGQQENYDAVFLEVVFAAARVDLTDKVIQALDAGH